MSSEAVTWAKAQDPVRPGTGRLRDPRAKGVLVALAAYADARGVAWAAVGILTLEASLGSERTCQRGLADLKAAGFLEETGEFETYRGKQIPKYRLALERGPQNTRERLALERERLGVTPVTPQDRAWGDTGDTPRGDTHDGLGVTPMTPKEIQLNNNPNSQGQREGRDALMVRLRAAYPRRALAWSDPAAAMIALAELEAAGIDIAELPGCAERMAQDPAIKRRDFGPPKLEAWLTKRQFEGHWLAPPAVDVAAPADLAAGIPADVVEALGAEFVRAWAPGAVWRGETGTLVTRLAVQSAKFRNEKRQVLEQRGWRVISAAETASQGEP